ncbi:MAG TPA: oligoendopeptidase F [Candidatus Bathyarchaeia archaeon]|nr:oligoendopeptidase F [Candidatus Bathyarchaeia archaeon]
MAKTNRAPLRNEVDPRNTWDLTPLYPDDAAWEKSFKRLERQMPLFERFRGKLAESAQNLRDCYDLQVRFEKEAERLGNYAHLNYSQDLANSAYQGMMARYMRLATRAGEAASFIAPEIQAIPRKKMDVFLKSRDLQPYKFQIEKLLRYKPHILSVKEERLLAMQGEVAESTQRIFEQLNDADLKFGTVKDDRGRSIALTHGSFRTLLESPSRDVRKNTFDTFYSVYTGHENTVGATLNASVLQDIYAARARNFPSALEAALFADKVPPSVYDNLIEAVHANLETNHKYLEVRRKALKLRDLHIYDTYLPIVSGLQKRISYDRAVSMVCEALEPLGGDYVKTLEAGLRGRWVDRYENAGKHSGAFSSGGYSGPPYILMNYKETVLDDVFTLAHEAGHSMHTYYSARSQSFQDYHYAILVAEVASTFNEQLLNHALIQKAKDHRTRAFLINREIDEIRLTLVRQTMFAEFEKIIHAAAEQGVPLTAGWFREQYQALLALYFGDRFRIDEPLSLECFRIPHFYHAFYVYKYATGLSAAIALSHKVLAGDTAARDRYLAFLRSGGSNYPLDLLRNAGVDLETPEPVDAAMQRLRELVDALDELVK